MSEKHTIIALGLLMAAPAIWGVLRGARDALRGLDPWLLAAVAAGGLAALAAGQAHAGPLDQYLPGQEDQGLDALRAIFGNPGGLGIFGDGPDKWAGAMLAFNSLIISLGAIWFVWNIVQAIVSSAHDGEILGRRFSSMWMPIRTVLGAASILPVWGGWSGAQILMAYCAAVGVGTANLVWSNGGIEIIKQAVPLPLQAPAVADAQATAEALFHAALCAAGSNAETREFIREGLTDKELTGRPAVIAQAEQTAKGVKIEFRQSAGATHPQWIGGCGGVELEWPAAPAGLPPGVIELMRGAQVSQLLQLSDKLIAFADHVGVVFEGEVGDPRTLDAGEVDRAALAYKRDTEAAWTAILLAARDSISDHVFRSQGSSWLQAGTTMRTVADAAAATAAASAQAKPQGAHPLHGPPVNPLTDVASAPTTWWESLKAAVTPSALGDRINQWAADAVRELAGAGVVDALGNGAGGMAGLVSFGNRLVAASAVLLAGWALLSALLGVGLTSGVTLVTAISPIVTGVLGATMILGVTLAGWLPYLPVVLWILAVVSWLVIVAEALIAAPLWALTHLDPEGEGLPQRSAHGYVFALNLLFRPSAMVLAFGFAVILYEWALTFTNGLMQSSIQMALGAGAWTALIMFLASVAVYCAMAITLSVAIFGMVSTLPDRVFSWIGGSSSSDVSPHVTSTGGGVKDAADAVGNGAAGAPGAVQAARRGRGPAAGPKPTPKPGPTAPAKS